MTRITEASAASILARLRNLARTEYPNLPANLMLLLYAQQGLLARLDASPHAGQFVLKGALSLFARLGNAARPTEDIDLAAQDLPNTPEAVAAVIRTLCAITVGDGLVFDPDSVAVRRINEALQYPGVGVTVGASLGSSRVRLQLDLSFGNAITPEPVAWIFPALLLPRGVPVRLYPLETVVTEKFAALLEIGEATTRMKDLYDLWVILSATHFEADVMRLALERSFAARATPLAAVAPTLAAEFAGSTVLNTRWRQYLSRTRFEAPGFAEVMALLEAFYRPLLLEQRRTGFWQPQEGRWLEE